MLGSSGRLLVLLSTAELNWGEHTEGLLLCHQKFREQFICVCVCACVCVCVLCVHREMLS
jgi:hypothetical protein